MNDLQIGLIAMGGIAVLGVLVYNKWQEYRHRKVAEQVMQADHEDVLLGKPAVERRREMAEAHAEPDVDEDSIAGGRREPVLTEDEASRDLPWNTEGERFAESPAASETLRAGAGETVSTGGTSPDEHADVADTAAGELPVALLDARIDFIVVMELVEPVAASQILYSQREALLRISKPVVWVGFNEKQREWEVIPPDTEKPYRRLRIGLQLADRRGPLSEADFTMFVACMQQLADELMAVADMSPRQSVIEQAHALDRFCADVDLEIGVHLVSRGTPFSGTKIRALAEAAGMVLDNDGLFTRCDDDGCVQFRLQNFESTLFTADTIKNLTTHGLTFLLDVPRVDHGERVFFQMVDNARRFADTLQGQLVDDNRQPLTEAQLDRIKREYVVKPQAAMSQFGLPAGSPQALRLFS